MAGPAMPTTTVQVAFQNNPFDTSLTWTDVTKYVTGFTTSMGRQHELQQVGPSTATIQLTNQDGRFSPWNTASPYYYSGTGLTVGHPVRIRATWSGTTYDVFYGYVKGWVPVYGAAKAAMSLQCYDTLALLNLNTLDTGQYGVFPIANATHYWPLTEAVGSTTAVDAAGSFDLTTPHPELCVFGAAGPFTTTTNTSVRVNYSVNQNSTLAASGSTGLGSTFSIEGWIKVRPTLIGGAGFQSLLDYGDVHLGLTNPNGYVQFTGAGGVNVSGSTNLIDSNWHYLVASYNGAVMSLYVDSVLVASKAMTVSSGGGYVSTATAATDNGCNIAQLAVYSVALTPAQIANQYAIGTAGFVTQDTGSRIAAILQTAGLNSSQYNLDTGNVTIGGSSSSLATSTVMSYINTIVNTERGVLYQDPSGVVQFRNRHYVYENSAGNTSQATFGYATGELHYLSSGLVPGLDDLDLWNNISVSRNGGVPQVVFDTASQTAYGRRTQSGNSGLLFINDNDSLDLAQGLLYQYKNPTARVRSIALSSTIAAGASLPQQLGRKLLDRITINWRPMDGTSANFSQQSLIEQISHTVTPTEWTTTLAVTPIGTESFFIIGTSTLGTGILGF